MVIGFMYYILYFNLFTFGYNINEYLKYILTRYECYIFFVGLLIFTIFYRKGKNNDLYIWFIIKFYR